MTVLLTGATGFLGSYLAAQLPEPPCCVVRGAGPQARLDAALAPLGASGVAVPGDVTRPLDVDLAGVTHIVHCAADVSFDRPLADARAINVAGARHVVELARRAPALERLVHVSTAYVAGIAPGRFRNSYEQSKHEAEEVVRAADVPYAIVRPSIVVGESRTGWTSSFNVLYPPLRALARGMIDTIPADPDAVVDVVPVDHVARVITAAMQWSTGPGTLHAVAGDGALRAGELAALAATELGRHIPVLDPSGADLPPGGLEVYAPYVTVRTRFD
ncbi:MAG: hypothetical protein QOI80_3399, partial [Solirubrobacteraceae bacterium]|nr:hypothetical protein [Solirubrobacteraceae bacterium]